MLICSLEDHELIRLWREDVPYLDLTTQVLEIGEPLAQIQFFARDPLVLCGSEEAGRLLTLVGATVTTQVASGSRILTGDLFLEGVGTVAVLHQVWRVALSLLEYASGVATQTDRMLKAAHQVDPKIMLLTSRKVIPGTKALAIKAIVAGGAYPHRLGLSETVLVFEEHLMFLGGIQALIEELSDLQCKLKEKKILVEVKAIPAALELAKAGIDGIQFDKLPPDQIQAVVPQIRAIHPSILLLAAGGIHAGNIASYARTGVDGLVSTSPYYAPPADIGVRFICKKA